MSERHVVYFTFPLLCYDICYLWVEFVLSGVYLYVFKNLTPPPISTTMSKWMLAHTIFTWGNAAIAFTVCVFIFRNYHGSMRINEWIKWNVEKNMCSSFIYIGYFVTSCDFMFNLIADNPEYTNNYYARVVTYLIVIKFVGEFVVAAAVTIIFRINGICAVFL